MRAPNEIPAAVRAGVERYCRQQGFHDPAREARDVQLTWDSINGCYCFTRAGVYVGVELDGYVHT